MLFVIILVIFIILLNLFLTYVGSIILKKVFKKKSLRIFTLLGIFIGLFICECLAIMIWVIQMFKVNPQKFFKSFITDPIPKDVKIIKGGGYGWLGYSVYLIFTADKNTIDNILTKYTFLPDCTVVDKYDKKSKNIKEKLELINLFKEKLTIIPDLTCYYKEGEYNEQDFLLWDKQKNKIFFYASGGS